MAVFTYRALAGGPTGASESGTIVADTARAARDQLRSRGLIIEHVAPTRGTPAPGTPGSLEPRNGEHSCSALHVDRDGAADAGLRLPHLRWRRTGPLVTSLLRELSTLLAVGIPLLEALDTVSRQYKSGTFGGSFLAVVLGLRDDVSRGLTLADAMRQHPREFDELCVSITEVGENSGTLEAALGQVADFRTRSQQLRGRVGTALLYPLIVLVMGLGVAIFLMTYVVPNLLALMTESGRQLPTTTLIVKTLSDLLRDYWWALIAGVLALVLLIRMVLAADRGRLAWHRLQLRLPGAGELVRKQMVVRVSLVMATLLRSGMEFVQALRIAAKTTPNLVLRDALAKCEQAVYAGRDIGPALEETHAFPASVVQVFAVGQHSGRLEEMLERLAWDYDKQVETAASRFTAVLEPVLIVVLASVIGFIAFATITPILEAGNVL